MFLRLVYRFRDSQLLAEIRQFYHPPMRRRNMFGGVCLSLTFESLDLEISFLVFTLQNSVTVVIGSKWVLASFEGKKVRMSLLYIEQRALINAG